MTDLSSLFQNRTFITVLILTVLAVMVGIKTVRVTPFVDSQAKTTLSLSSNFSDQTETSQDVGGDTQISNPQPARSTTYALVIAMVAEISPTLKQNLTCHESTPPCDKRAFTSLIILQYLLALISLVAVFLIAFTLSQSWKVANFTLVFAFIAGVYGGYAGLINDLIYSHTFMLLFLLGLALGVARDERRWTFVAGLALGSAALFLPVLWGVGLISAACFFFVARVSNDLKVTHPNRHALALISGLGVVAACIAVSPYGAELRAAAIAHLQDGLIQRGRLSSLDGWHQLSLLLSPLPLVGNILQKILGLVPTQAIDAAAANVDGAGTLWSQLLATPGIFLRGLWVGSPILTLMGLAQIYPLVTFAREDLKLGPTLIVAIPVFAVVVLNAAFTANTPAYNVGLVFLLTYTTGYLIARAEVRRHFWAAKEKTGALAPAT